MHNLDDIFLTRPGFKPNSTSFEPQLDQMSHRARRSIRGVYAKCILPPTNDTSATNDKVVQPVT